MTTARDTIVDALDIESFVLCAGGLKAPNMTAQGNALGLSVKNISSPERAAQTSRDRLVSPLQGVKFFWGYESQGVALGYHVVALSARDPDAQKNYERGFKLGWKLSSQPGTWLDILDTGTTPETPKLKCPNPSPTF
jgi:hypothetical protein